jgi:sugar lactone lactonase YvrE
MHKFFSAFSILFLLSISINAADASIWSLVSRADVLKGESRGVSIADNGSISPAPRLTEVFKTDQQFVWSSAVDAAGNVYLGTGGDGRLFKVDAAGKGSLLADFAEMNVSAVAVGRNGEIFAATLPDGKVYNVAANGSSTVFFDPQEKYIWSLAVYPDGSLAVGTGENGKIYRVRAAGAAPAASVLFDTSETHIISLAVDKNGNLFAGSDSNGIVLRFGADGKPFALLDSPLREIHELAVGADGSVYALALAESVGAAKPDPATATPTEAKPVTVEKPTAMPTETPNKSRYDLSTAKSAVYRLYPDGASDIIWNSATVAAFAVAAGPNGVLVGTSDRGRVYGVGNDGRETLILQTDEGQVSTLKSVGAKFFAGTSNSGKLFGFGSETNAEGTYESPVLDAKSTASWGRIWWSATGSVSVQTRSGNTERPSETWSAWSAAATDSNGAAISSPKARYFQWRAVVKSGGALGEVRVSFAGRNIAPEVLSIQVLPANIGLASNPAIQLDPNIEKSRIDPVLFGVIVPPPTPRRVFQRAARAIQWTAEDRNGDHLVYDVYYRRTNESFYRLVKEGIPETFFTLDGQALIDGTYVVKIVARDSASNPAGAALSGDRISEPFEIDNSAPVVTVVSQTVAGDVAKISFDSTESTSYIVRAEYSVNGSDWLEAFAADGISDGRAERYNVETRLNVQGEYSIALRVFDSSGNIGTAQTTVKR